MSKKVKAKVKLMLPAGGATPAPPVGSSLGQHQVPLMDFCKKFNAETSHLKGSTVPVLVTVYEDKSFIFETKTPPASEELRKRAGISKGSSTPGSKDCGSISWDQVEEIAKLKMKDLNAIDIDSAKKIVAGTARSMGLKIEGN